MNNDDFQLRSFQDDLATDDNATDPIMDESGDDPTEELGIPASEFKSELDKEITDEDNDGIPRRDFDILDDQRENIEDLDDDSDDK
jgi:hypothetical protein